MEDIVSSFDNKINQQLTYVSYDRMAGGTSSKSRYETKTTDKNFGNILSSYQMQPEPIKIDLTDNKEKPFGFLDVLDMVNPLQHIPIINYIYRAITGDEIKPVSKIVGGVIFGGAAGAASGIVNAIVEEETGKDIVENAISFVGSDKKPPYNIEQEKYAYKDLPASLLAFTKTPTIEKHITNNSDKTEIIVQGRSAGTISVYS